MHADDPQRVPAEVSQEVSQAEALDDVFRQERAARIAAAQQRLRPAARNA